MAYLILKMVFSWLWKVSYKDKKFGILAPALNFEWIKAKIWKKNQYKYHYYFKSEMWKPVKELVECPDYLTYN